MSSRRGFPKCKQSLTLFSASSYSSNCFGFSFKSQAIRKLVIVEVLFDFVVLKSSFSTFGGIIRAIRIYVSSNPMTIPLTNSTRYGGTLSSFVLIVNVIFVPVIG